MTLSVEQPAYIAMRGNEPYCWAATPQYARLVAEGAVDAAKVEWSDTGKLMRVLPAGRKVFTGWHIKAVAHALVVTQ